MYVLTQVGKAKVTLAVCTSNVTKHSHKISVVCIRVSVRHWFMKKDQQRLVHSTYIVLTQCPNALEGMLFDGKRPEVKF